MENVEKLKEYLNKNKPTVIYELPHMVLQDGDRIFKGENGKYYLETYKRKEITITRAEEWK